MAQKFSNQNHRLFTYGSVLHIKNLNYTHIDVVLL